MARSPSLANKTDVPQDAESEQQCPVCDKKFSLCEIEVHVNRCIFLNTESTATVDPGKEQKRKRTLSNPLITNGISPTTSPSKKMKTATLSSFFHSKKKPMNGMDDSKSLDNLVECMREFETVEPVGHMKAEAPSTKMLTFTIPLATQVQPKSLDDFFGQNHVLGQGTILRNLLQQGDVPCMIIWGPPGCGKTSLSNVIKETCKANPSKMKFVSFCAATSGVKDVQKVIQIAKTDLAFGKKTVLFMDEIHRFNKKQQDIFLLHVEKGDIILVGATTENPSFYINSALLSRCRVIVMQKLDDGNLCDILRNGLKMFGIQVLAAAEDPFVALDSNRVAIEEEAIKWLADISDGDARIALGNLQLALQNHGSRSGLITLNDVKEEIKKSHMLYDRKGEEHYNVISAMHKSIRASDDNAAVYWTTRMIVSGEDPLYIARRMVRAASEDIGNADPSALQLAVSTMQGCHLLGLPECDVLLSQCAIYLARAPKSREADSALARAKQLIAGHKGSQPNVPMHLRNAPTKLMKDLGYGRLERGTQLTYMPPELKDVDFFN